MRTTPTLRSGCRWPTSLVVLVLLSVGCGPTVGIDDTTTSSSSGEAESSGTPGTTAGITVSSSDGADGTTTSTSTDTGEPPSGYEDDGVDTGCAFTCPNPPPPPPPPGGGWCNLTCFEGEKCMPWANDGGMVWNAVRCTPLADQPGAPGEPCQVEGSQWSGIDDCDEGVMCWQVDPKTNEGVCHAFCGGTEDQPLCPADSDCVTLPEIVPLCVVSCDPLVPSCDVDERCLPSGSGFTCLPSDGLGAALGEPCGAPGACATDGLCAFDPAFSCGNAPGEGCCATPCDVNAPGPCGGPGSLCVPWFPVRPPPELAHLGVCVLP